MDMNFQGVTAHMQVDTLAPLKKRGNSAAVATTSSLVNEQMVTTCPFPNVHIINTCPRPLNTFEYERACATVANIIPNTNTRHSTAAALLSPSQTCPSRVS